jgi:hypothetical protein
VLFAFALTILWWADQTIASTREPCIGPGSCNARGSDDAGRVGTDPRLSSVSPVCCIVELGLIRDLPAPGLSAAKPSCAGWLPKHRCGSVSNRTHEVPLPAAEMPVARNQHNSLIHASELNPQPNQRSNVSCCLQSYLNLLLTMFGTPSNLTFWTCVGAIWNPSPQSSR